MKRKIFFIISILLLTFTSAFAREYTTEEAKEISENENKDYENR